MDKEIGLPQIEMLATKLKIAADADTRDNDENQLGSAATSTRQHKRPTGIVNTMAHIGGGFCVGLFASVMSTFHYQTPQERMAQQCKEAECTKIKEIRHRHRLLFAARGSLISTESTFYGIVVTSIGPKSSICNSPSHSLAQCERLRLRI
jgi:hypothetical protein